MQDRSLVLKEREREQEEETEKTFVLKSTVSSACFMRGQNQRKESRRSLSIVCEEEATGRLFHSMNESEAEMKVFRDRCTWFLERKKKKRRMLIRRRVILILANLFPNKRKSSSADVSATTAETQFVHLNMQWTHRGQRKVKGNKHYSLIPISLK